MALIALVAAQQLGAQAVRGTVTDSTAHPLPGVVVSLVDSAADDVVARQLTDDHGLFLLRAPGAGTYRLDTRRIGYLPTASPPFTIGGDAPSPRVIVLARLRVALDTVRVMAPGSCAADTSNVTFTLWDQLRAALAATQVTAEDAGNASTVMIHESVVDASSFARYSDVTTFQTEHGATPWSSLSADSLRRAGYVERGVGVTRYHAPNIDVLLSDIFLADHCIRLVVEGGRTGIAFEPVRDRRSLPEIAGTLWFDRASLELQRMEFHYVNVIRMEEGSGGTMAFVKLANGMWLVDQWEINMPEFPREYRLHGGDLVAVSRGSDTLWSTPPVPVLGTVTDSATHAPIAGVRVAVHGTPEAVTSDGTGNFVFLDLLPGRYVLDVNSAAYDSIGLAKHYVLELVRMEPVEIHLPSPMSMATAMCGSLAPGTGVIAGSVTLPVGAAPGDSATVTATWLSGSGTTAMDAYGEFHLCSVPVNQPVTLQATWRGRTTAPSTTSISPNQRISTLGLAFSR